MKISALCIAAFSCLAAAPAAGVPVVPVVNAIGGDPHLQNWKGEWFDYMGECDLKLLHVPQFDGTQDMDIHVRTTIRYDYSYVEAAAIKIGDDVFEVGSFGAYALNGVEGAAGANGHQIPSLGGYPVIYTQVNDKKHSYDIIIGEGQKVTISAFKDWVNVQITNADKEVFGEASGLMGTFDGEMQGRDGAVIEDMNEIGQAWQVQPEEPLLFRTARAPQAPQSCRLPDANQETAQEARRLGGGAVSKEDAEHACAHLQGSAFSFCVDDVMASGDLDAAQILGA